MSSRFRSLATGLLFCIAVPAAAPGNSAPQSAPERALPPIGHTAFCERYPGDCEASAGKPTRPRDAAERLGEVKAVHAKVNGAIAARPDTDPADRSWLIWPKSGDCDDYAVTKRHVLLERGWPSADLLLAEVVLPESGEHHLLLIVRDDTDDWVLDNRKRDIARLSEIRRDYKFERIQASDDPKFWIGPPAELARN